MSDDDRQNFIHGHVGCLLEVLSDAADGCIARNPSDPQQQLDDLQVIVSSLMVAYGESHPNGQESLKRALEIALSIIDDNRTDPLMSLPPLTAKGSREAN